MFREQGEFYYTPMILFFQNEKIVNGRSWLLLIYFYLVQMLEQIMNNVENLQSSGTSTVNPLKVSGEIKIRQAFYLVNVTVNLKLTFHLLVEEDTFYA